jgi:hypothetical protein
VYYKRQTDTAVISILHWENWDTGRLNILPSLLPKSFNKYVEQKFQVRLSGFQVIVSLSTWDIMKVGRWEAERTGHSISNVSSVHGILWGIKDMKWHKVSSASKISPSTQNLRTQTWKIRPKYEKVIRTVNVRKRNLQIGMGCSCCFFIKLGAPGNRKGQGGAAHNLQKLRAQAPAFSGTLNYVPFWF